MENLSNEIWKDIIEYKGLYQISNYGRVKALEKIVITEMCSYLRKEKILKPRKNRDGYMYINLRIFKNPKSYMVHRLVANAFLPKIRNKNIVNHIDFIKHNNIANNLEWCNQKENVRHSIPNMIKTKRLKHFR